MEVIAIKAQKKEGSGKSVSSRLRRDGFTPCVMYGSGEPQSFVLTEPDYRHLVYSPDFRIVEIELDGKKHKCILKEIQFEPLSGAVRHLDFLMLEPKKQFKAKVPLRFKGVSPGVKLGGKFLPLVRTINVFATPETVVSEIFADISTMDLGSTIRVKDIEVPQGVTVINTGSTPIAAIEIPRALKSAQSKEGK